MSEPTTSARASLVPVLVGAGVLVAGALVAGGWFLFQRAADEAMTFDVGFYARLSWEASPELVACRVDLPFGEQSALSQRIRVQADDTNWSGLDVCVGVRTTHFGTQCLVELGDKRLVVNDWPMPEDGRSLGIHELLVPVDSNLTDEEDRARDPFGDSSPEDRTPLSWTRVEGVTRLSIEHPEGQTFELELIERGFELGGQAFVLGTGRQVLMLSGDGELLEVQNVDEVERPPRRFQEDLMRLAR
jgi:hypothetical protein